MLVFLSRVSFATPQVVRVDGSIFDASGAPISASKDIQIKAYDAATGGSLLWASDVYTAVVSTSRFTINMDAASGSSPSLGSQIGSRTSGQGIYFQIEVDSGAADGNMDSATVVLPRIRAKGAMFALNAAQADSLKGVSVASAEINFLSGTTAGVQTQINALTDSIGVKADASALAGVSATTVALDAKVTALQGATMALGSQISMLQGVTGNFLLKAGGTMTGNLGLDLVTPSRFLMVDSARKIVSSATAVTDTEFGYLSGLTLSVASKLNGATANIQTQINTLKESIQGAPNAFNFSNQTGVATNTVITSNGVTLSGFVGAVVGACTGCTDILRNGTPLGSTWGVFLAGNTVAIKQLSSVTVLTATTASLTVGTTTSDAWSVTTGLNTPDAFSFSDQTGIMTGATVTSNAVTLTGTFSTVTATCGTGCVGISRNGSDFTGGPVAGFVPGDTIAIRQIASGGSLASTTASVIVGSTTSGAWSATTWSDPCGTSPSVGTVCTDGSVYVGLSPDGNVPMYATRCDLGQTWNGSSCTGTRQWKLWAQAGTVFLGLTSTTTGESNTAAMVALGTSPSPAPYDAARACAVDLSGTHGRSDWYLPAKDELNVMTGAVYTALGTFSAGSNYRSASEISASGAWAQVLSNGSQVSGNKTGAPYVRCVRK